MVIVPTDVPGAIVPPLSTVMVPSTVPVPPNVLSLPIVTSPDSVPETDRSPPPSVTVPGKVPDTVSRPPVTSVVPVKLLLLAENSVAPASTVIVPVPAKGTPKTKSPVSSA